MKIPLQTVTIEVTYHVEVVYQIEVPLVSAGVRDAHLRVPTRRAGERMVTECITSEDWHGRSMLGKAFTRAGLDPWTAIRMKVVRNPLSTFEARTQARQRKEWA